MNEFVTWAFIATFAGTVAMTTLVTQFIKGLTPLKDINSQFVSYVIACIVMTLATYFTDTLSVENLVLIFFNALIVSLASNGGYDALKTIFRSENSPK